MSEDIALGHVIPTDPFDGDAYAIIFDPGKSIVNPQNMFDMFKENRVYTDTFESFSMNLDKLKTKSQHILFIFNTGSSTEIRRFLLKHRHICDAAHSIYLIFHNGLTYDDQWKHNQIIPKLRWCRSYTTKLISDVQTVCRTVYNESITYYEQRLAEEQAAYDKNATNSAFSLINLFAVRKALFCRSLSVFLQMEANSDD